MKAPFLRTEFNYDMLAASNVSALDCQDASLAVQESRDECDINTILKRFGLTGQLPQGVRAPQYGDFEGVADYQSALNAVIAADDAFMQMPYFIRDRFHNDPAAFVDFCSKEENRAEAEKLGLVVPKAPPVEVQPEVKGVPKGAAKAAPGGAEGA